KFSVSRILMKRTFVSALVLSFFLISVSAQTKQPATDDYNSIFKALKWRSICATGVVGDPKTYYMCTVGGGLWKTDDMGLTWRNVSDGFFKTGTIGAVAVAESDPNVVYVGMGEHAVRGVMTSS